MTAKPLPKAPEGYRWLRASQIIERGDVYVREGAIASVTRDDIGTLAGAPFWHGGHLYHYARPIKRRKKKKGGAS